MIIERYPRPGPTCDDGQVGMRDVRKRPIKLVNNEQLEQLVEEDAPRADVCTSRVRWVSYRSPWRDAAQRLTREDRACLSDIVVRSETIDEIMVIKHVCHGNTADGAAESALSVRRVLASSDRDSLWCRR